MSFSLELANARKERMVVESNALSDDRTQELYTWGEKHPFLSGLLKTPFTLATMMIAMAYPGEEEKGFQKLANSKFWMGMYVRIRGGSSRTDESGLIRNKLGSYLPTVAALTGLFFLV